MRRRVAFQGDRGAFGEEAIAAIWPNETEPVPLATFADVVQAVAAEHVDAGVLPVENAIAGCVHESVAAIAASDSVSIIGETLLPISLCLTAPEGARIATLTSVASHPMALAQCTNFFRRHPRIAALPAWDTAGAARTVATANDPQRGAIAGRCAAARHGLEILAEGIEDESENSTRFAIIAPISSRRAAASLGIHRWRRHHAIRGATTADADEPEQIRVATRDLLRALVDRNGIKEEDIVSVLFSVTNDLTSEFPARAARDLGWTATPLMCMTEIPVPGALARCVRVMLHVELEHPRAQMAPVYLRGAEILRQDLASSLDPATVGD